MATPSDAAAACRKCVYLLTLLANQQDQIKYATPLRFTLVVYLLTRILPMPLPLNHPGRGERCFWQQNMTYETQADVIRQLHLIMRHFAAAAFAVRPDRETDAARVCVAGAAVAIVDASMRRPLDPNPARRSCMAAR